MAAGSPLCFRVRSGCEGTRFAVGRIERRFASHRHVKVPREGREVLCVVRVWALIVLEKHVKTDDLFRPEVAERVRIETICEKAQRCTLCPASASKSNTNILHEIFNID
jgi:hypothetical protein